VYRIFGIKGLARSIDRGGYIHIQVKLKLSW